MHQTGQRGDYRTFGFRDGSMGQRPTGISGYGMG